MIAKKIYMAVFAVSVGLPMTVYGAWQLGTRVMSAGGTLQVRNDTPQTGGSGSIFKTYTTHQNVQVTSTATTGYLISRYNINGTDYSPSNAASLVNQMGLIAFPSLTSQTFSVYFSPWMTSVTVTAGDNGGSVSPSGTSSLQYTTSKSYTFTPGSGNQVVAIDGLPAMGYTLSPATIPAPVNTPVTLALTIPQTPLTITGYFLGVVANPGSTQTVPLKSVVTLDGSGSYIKAGGGTLTYAWTQTSGRAVTLSSSTAAKPTFTAYSSGTYNFKLTVTNGTYTNAATTAVNATRSAAATARSTCQNCHQGVGVGSSQNVFPNWSSSSHEKKFVMCANCHVGADTGGHPGNLGPGTVNETTFTFTGIAAPRTGNFCFTCHHRGNNLHFNTETQLANICGACHTLDVHNPAATMSLSLGAQHFNGYTSPVNPNFAAAYVTPATQCANCHIAGSNGTPDAASDPVLLQERTDWATSGHADPGGSAWLARDFKTLDGCVQCHTAKGFIAYSSTRMTAAWGTGSDVTRAVLSCNGCHTDFATGALRSSTPLRPYANDSYTSPDMATSNLCMSCHSGTRSGRSIKALSGADLTGLTFTGPHYSPAAGILFKSIGYEFAGRDYSNTWHFRHDRIGVSNYTVYGFDTGTGGPCIGCHMRSPQQHSFSPVTKDAAGSVTAITGTSCAGCHTGPAYLDAGRMNVRKAKFAASLLALRKVLERAGIYYGEADPFFFKSQGNTGPANAFTTWGNADTLGSAFNFSLLQHEPAAYAHNMLYAKRLIYDSIDFMDDGTMNDSVGGTITGMTELDPSQRAMVLGYIVPGGSRP